jgi:hypothetical protein
MAPGGVVPDPPRYEKCAAELRVTSAHLARRSAQQLEGDCKRRYTSLEQRVMASLIGSAWLRGEAVERHLPQSNGGVLTGSQTRALTREVIGSVLSDSRAGARAQAVRYYQENKSRFDAPEQRDAEVVRTKTLTASMQAAKAIRAGDPFALVAARDSVDAAGKENGGLVHGIVLSQEDPPLKRAVFKASLHVLTGPVQLEPGRFYLFEIVGIRPARHVSLARIEAALMPKLERRALAKFSAEWAAKWTAMTSCSSGFVVAGCRQYKGPRPTDKLNPFLVR